MSQSINDLAQDERIAELLFRWKWMACARAAATRILVNTVGGPPISEAMRIVDEEMQAAVYTTQTHSEHTKQRKGWDCMKIDDHARAAAVQLGNMTAPDNNARARVIAEHMQAAVAELEQQMQVRLNTIRYLQSLLPDAEVSARTIEEFLARDAGVPTRAELEQQLAAMQQRAEAAEVEVEQLTQAIADSSVAGKLFSAQRDLIKQNRDERRQLRELAEAAEQRAVEAERKASFLDSCHEADDHNLREWIKIAGEREKQLHAHREALRALRGAVRNDAGAWTSLIRGIKQTATGDIDREFFREWAKAVLPALESALALADELTGKD